MSEDNFNQLSPAETERLAMLFEEAGEIVQAVGKIIRHGYAMSYNDGLNNREALVSEIRDLRAVLRIMEVAGDLDPRDPAFIDIRRRLQYTHHQPVYLHVEARYTDS
jgi:hypothetical protein